MGLLRSRANASHARLEAGVRLRTAGRRVSRSAVAGRTATVSSGHSGLVRRLRCGRTEAPARARRKSRHAGRLARRALPSRSHELSAAQLLSEVSDADTPQGCFRRERRLSGRQSSHRLRGADAAAAGSAARSRSSERRCMETRRATHRYARCQPRRYGAGLVERSLSRRAASWPCKRRGGALQRAILLQPDVRRRLRTAPIDRRRVPSAALSPINWGEFRAHRTAGDYADYGDYHQISHYSQSGP